MSVSAAARTAPRDAARHATAQPVQPAHDAAKPACAAVGRATEASAAAHDAAHQGAAKPVRTARRAAKPEAAHAAQPAHDAAKPACAAVGRATKASAAAHDAAHDGARATNNAAQCSAHAAAHEAHETRDTHAAPACKKNLLGRMAERFGIEPALLLASLRATAFRPGSGEVSNEQMLALLLVAEQYGLNPFTREIFALQDQGGIVPVVGVDGWSRIINAHPQFDGMEFLQDEASCTCILYRKDRSHAVKVTEYLGECRRDHVAPWQSHPRRMLRHKALIQCARLAFGLAGIYDPDEAERIIFDSEFAQAAPSAARTTPQSAAQANLPEGYAEYEAATLPLMQAAASAGAAQLAAAFNALLPSSLKKAFWTRHGAALKAQAAAHGAAHQIAPVSQDVPQ